MGIGAYSNPDTENGTQSKDLVPFHRRTQCFQLSRVIQEAPDFRVNLPVSRLEYEISQIIAKVWHFFSRLDLTLKFQLSLFCID